MAPNFKKLTENVIREFVLDIKQLERFSMSQSLALVLKVKPFKIFTAIHNSTIWLAAKVVLSINSHFLTAYIRSFQIQIILSQIIFYA